MEASSIGKSVRIEGALSGAEDLLFDGTLHGTVQLPRNRLTLGPNSHTEAAIEVKHLALAGTLEGDIQGAESVEFRSTARFTGKLQCRRLSIEEGAMVKAQIDMLRDAAEPTPASAASTSASTTQSAASPAQLAIKLG
ncbi:MAG: polymer-forming cytoskeletal protein [Acidobacteriaceae bacterium]